MRTDRHDEALSGFFFAILRTRLKTVQKNSNKIAFRSGDTAIRQHAPMTDIRFPTRRKLDLRSSGMLRGVDW